MTTPEELATTQLLSQAVAEGAGDLATRMQVLHEAVTSIRLSPPLPPSPPQGPEFVFGDRLDDTNVGAGLLRPVTKTVTGTNGLLSFSGDTEFVDTRFECFIDPKAQLARFVNCEFAGPQTPKPLRALIKAFASSNHHLQHEYDFCTWSPTIPWNQAAMHGHHFTVTRSKVERCGDGFAFYHPDQAARLDVVVDSTWIGGLVWFADDHHADGSHNDCIQLYLNGRGIIVRGCRLDALLGPDDLGDNDQRDGQGMSCFMWSTVGQVLEDVLVYANDMEGGTAKMNFATWATAKNFRIIQNDFVGPSPAMVAKVALHPSLVRRGNRVNGVANDAVKKG